MTDFLFHILYLSSCLLYIFLFLLFWCFFEKRIRQGKYRKRVVLTIDFVFTLILQIVAIANVVLIFLGFTFFTLKINYGYLNFLVYSEIIILICYLINNINEKIELYHMVRNSLEIKTRKKKTGYQGRAIKNPYEASLVGLYLLISSFFIYLTNFNKHNIEIHSLFFILSDLITTLICIIFICLSYYILIHDYYILSNKKKILFTILNIIAFFIAVKNFFDYSYLTSIDDGYFHFILFIVYTLSSIVFIIPTKIVNKYVFTNKSSINYQRRENKFLKEIIQLNNASFIYSIYMLITSLVLLMINIYLHKL